MYKTQRNYENAQRMLFDGVGQYDIPELEPVQFDNAEFIGFNYARNAKEPENKAVHFFLDDYQFTRVWTDPDKYTAMLQRFKYVLTPDFSLYTDFPKSLQIYNHYRKHWLGAYWQANGINVIPTISWSGKESFDWCFDGEPIGGCVAVSSVGTQINKDTARLFAVGYAEMLARLQPKMIFFYGIIPDGCDGNIFPLTAFQEKFRKI